MRCGHSPEPIGVGAVINVWLRRADWSYAGMPENPSEPVLLTTAPTRAHAASLLAALEDQGVQARIVETKLTSGGVGGGSAGGGVGVGGGPAAGGREHGGRAATDGSPEEEQGVDIVVRRADLPVAERALRELEWD